MTEDVRSRRQIGRVIFTLSFLAWVYILVISQRGGTLHMILPHSAMHYGVTHPIQSMMALIESMATLILHGGALLNWVVMLVAMMAPLLGYSLYHVWYRSLKRRRISAISLFVLGYASIWLLAGFMILMIKFMLGIILPHSYLPILAFSLVAVIWQCSPVKQRCLNRNHNHPALSAFGLPAIFDVLRFGLSHGLWCVGSCWLLMLLPALLVQGHLVIMGLATFIMINDNLDRPSNPRWHIRIPRRLLKIIIGQSKNLINSRLTVRSSVQSSQVS